MSRDFDKALQQYDEQFQAAHSKEIDSLNKNEKKIFKHIMQYHHAHWMDMEVNGFIPNLNTYFQNQYPRLMDLMIPKEFREDFDYMLEKFNKFQYSENYTRRSFRSKDYAPFRKRAIDLMSAYYLTGFRNTDINDMGKYLSGTDSPYSMSLSQQKTNDSDGYLIAARIDKGDTNVIETIKEMMNSERNTEILTVSVIRAVFCCDNAELHDLMCRLLLAARLSEGLRQAICENADCGTAEAFIKIVTTINDNHMVRFSAVKRAVGTWTGLCRYEDPDRLAEKMLKDIPFVLASRENALGKIMTTDAVDIYMGLWGIGFYDVHEALENIKELLGIRKASFAERFKALFQNPSPVYELNEIQLLAIGYFCMELQYPDITAQAALAVIEKYPDNYKLFSVYRLKYPYDHNADNRNHSVQKMRQDTQLAEKHYHILLGLYENMPQKALTFSPILYPWFGTSVTKGQILACMLDCAVILKDNNKIDFLCDHITEFDLYSRHYAIKSISENIATPKQRETIINAVADKESMTRGCAVEILGKQTLSESEYQMIENFARFKTADLRSGVLELLKKRDEKGIETSILRMLKAKEENTRLAALDMLQYGLSSYPKNDFTAAKQAALSVAAPTEREQILIAELTGERTAEKVTKENGYDLYNPKAQLAPPDFHPDSNIVGNYFGMTKNELNEIYRGLMRIIDENAEKEFKDHWGEERILGNMGALYYYYLTSDDTEELEKNMPFSELWNRFYEEIIRTPQRFFAYSLELSRLDENSLTKSSRKTVEKNLKLFFGELADYSRAAELESEDERFTNYRFASLNSDVISYIRKRYHLSIPMEVLQHFVGYITLNMTQEELWLERQKSDRYYYGSDKKYDFTHTYAVNRLISELHGRINEDFETNFRLLHALSEKLDVLGHIEREEIGRYTGIIHVAPEYYLKAYRIGLIDKDIFLKSMMEIVGLSNANRELSIFVSHQPLKFPTNSHRENNVYVRLLAEEGKTLCDDDTIPQNSQLYQNGHLFAQEIIDKVLDVELKRGDSETVFSRSVKSIQAIYGIDRLVQILKALGNESLKTNYYISQISKKDSLSHLLSVCYPTAEDNAEKLKTALKGSQIKADRLIEIAMYAPQWIDIIESYLGIKGMKSGCYYFMAHTSEHIDEKREAIIAKYTPLTVQELNGGCFDVKWFLEVYKTLGEKSFEKLYKSAKYSSAGNKHTRARKYADAALGKMNIMQTETLISDKRNKDLLMALAIIPSKEKADILQRYEFIQNFLKESKHFGAQRRASEGEAVAFALKNLAVTAGYSDETRLTLSMETALAEENSHYFDFTQIGDYDVKITVDILGKASLTIEKGGKTLKSVPAALKKDEQFLQIKAFCEKLKQQYSRTVKMFETAMEERDSFTFGELHKLSENPVTKAITENIVFMAAEGEFVSGLPVEQGLCDYHGTVYALSEDTSLRVAHPFDLYEKGIWSDYQKMLLELGSKEGRKQPFRQVFRELYVKLSEELDKDRSLMFAGNRIQTKRTVGALKSRRWVADYEDGLQKIYYKDNIIASIYAQADWFSPGDMEAPTLEGVFFADRKTGILLKISDVPAIIYSEIMRDVDLAVSVAHAGGVDPETTHSTVEMRRVILEFNLSLFGITNVRFEKNHAFIDGKHGQYTIHLGSGVIHKVGGHQINVLAVGSGKKSKLFLPFIDEDPKTAEIMTKVLTFAEDGKIKDPYIMEQIQG